ncbi:MAG: HD domain-containing protein [Candidatus Sumerlaeia bacterium]|nr:HD domain-containing protein [Candidatus Sumerlaeia bacterium]
MNEFRRPGLNLDVGDQPTQKVRCPIHGFIHYSANERRIIDHPIFRRLRSIRQLALTEYVYPGATHTRFEHSLGVMEVVTRAFESLCSRHGATLEAHFRNYPYFKDGDHPLDRARQVLRLTALLHDTGHAPFSHAAESVIQKDGHHEELSIQAIKNDTIAFDEKKDKTGFPGLKSLIDGCWGDGTANVVASLLPKKTDPHLRILKDLVSGEIDADRMDYLLRDSHHCGVDYGRFDYRRLIECLSISPDDLGIPSLALHESGLQTYEALLMARFQMNTQVYYHRIRRIYDFYLKRYHEEIKGTVFNSPTSVLRQNDFTMLARISEDARNTDAPGYRWAKRIAERNHHNEVFSLGVVQWNAKRAESEKLLLEQFEKLKDTHPEADLILDLCEEKKAISLHKLIQEADERIEEESPERRMKLMKRGGVETLLGLESIVLGKVPRQFKLPRLFAAPRQSDTSETLSLFDDDDTMVMNLDESVNKLRIEVETSARELFRGV